MTIVRKPFRPRVWIDRKAGFCFETSGFSANNLARLFVPTQQECRDMLRELPVRLDLSRAMMAGFLGASVAVLRKWELEFTVSEATLTESR